MFHKAVFTAYDYFGFMKPVETPDHFKGYTRYNSWKTKNIVFVNKIISKCDRNQTQRLRSLKSF